MLNGMLLFIDQHPAHRVNVKRFWVVHNQFEDLLIIRQILKAVLSFRL
jgi:hypothetical protein